MRTITSEEKHFLQEKLTSAEYRFAKTMPDDPHYYTLRKTWENDEDFVKAVMLIRECGYHGQYKGRDYVYFSLGDYYYWTMGEPINKDGKPWTILINRAKREDADYERNMGGRQ